MKVVIFDNPDGTITVRIPAQNPAVGSPAVKRDDETDDEHFERLVSGPNRKGGSRIAVMDHTQLPTGNEHFKSAREWNGSAVIVNMSKARAIHMDRIRAVRDLELDKKDRLWMRASGQRDQIEADRVEAERQVLRDVPQTFDLTATTTAAELNALWPRELSPRPSS